MAVNGDIKAHEATYNSVIKLMFRGAIAVFIVALGIIWLISRK